MSRQNVYKLLELDYDVDDYKEIEKAITKKRQEWSRLQNHPSKRNEALANLEALKKINIERMKDPELRREEAEKAKQIDQEEQAERDRIKYANLDAMIAVISKKGWIEQAEVQLMMKEFNLSSKEIESRIALPIENKLAKPTETKRKKVSTLRAENIKNNCEKLGIQTNHISGIPSIYDFLQLSPSSSTEALLQEAEEIYDRIKDSKKSATNNIEKDLQSQCVSILRNNREQYNEELSQLRLKRLNDFIKLAGATQNLPFAVYEELVRQAMGFGDLSEPEAKRYIEDFCSEHDIHVQDKEQSSTPQSIKICGVCGLVNDNAHRYCSGCQTDLEIVCPSCSNQASTNDQACGHCGFKIGNMKNVPRTLDLAKQLIYEGNFERGKQLLNSILVWWPNHPEALQNLDMVEDIEKEKQKIFSKMNSLIEKKHYYTARSLFIKHHKLVQSSLSLKNMEKESLNQIHLTQNYLKQANNMTDEEKKVDFYVKALEISADCKEAQQFLAKYPPSPPSSLQISTDAANISLKWKESRAQGPIVYRLLRKKGEASKHPRDGEVLQETSDCAFNDRTAVGGYPYYYSLYAVRGSIVSKSSINQGPFIRRAEVEDIEVVQEDNVIEIKWTKPPGASHIEVWRKEDDIPRKRQDGTLLNGVTDDGVVDKNVVYGKSYGYLIVAVYQMDGKTFYSEGLTRKSKMTQLPNMLENMTVTRNDDGILLAWNQWNATEDSMHIYYSQTPFDFPTEGPISLDEIPDQIDRFEVNSEMNHKTLSFDNMEKPIYILPISQNNDIALVGKPIISKEHPEVSNVRHWVDKNDLVIQWDWPNGINEVVIVCGKESFPKHSKDSADTITRVIRKGSYDALNGYKITSETRDYYFSIFTQYEENGELVQSNGVQYLCMNSEQVSLLYNIQINKIFNRGIFVQMRSDVPITLPNLVLVKNTNYVPRKKEQGEVILRIPTQKLNGTEAFYIPYKYADKNAYAKLFFENEQDAQKIRLQAEGGKDSLRLW